MAKIFITGITGFLGSNIAQHLLEQNHILIATYRDEASKNSCTDFLDKIHWVLQSGDDWTGQVIKLEPEIVIHCAWIGVNHQERDSWAKQIENINFLNDILLITSKSNAAKFVALGSQAEYGMFTGCVDENYPLNPTGAYGRVKVVCSELVKQYCNHHKINWYWLRLFSFFGKGESDKWLLPSIVQKIFQSDHIDLTGGEQKYSYLYVDDLGKAVNSIIINSGLSGIYNISGNKIISIKELVQKVTDLIKPSFQLNFGKLPYRQNQPMYVQGDNSKFVKEFGEFDVSNFDQALVATVEDLKERYGNQQDNESF